MREPERIPRIMAKLQKLWEKYPELRFFQLINVTELFYLEDDDFEKQTDAATTFGILGRKFPTA